MNSRYRRERRQPPYYLLTGLILGISFGLLISFVVLPVHYTNVPPETLSLQAKDNYRLMIASAYQYDQNLDRAQVRISLLREGNSIDSFENQAARSESKTEAQVLLDFVKVLKSPSAVVQNTPVVQTPAPDISPTATVTPTVFISPTPLQTDDGQAVRTATPQIENTRPANTPRPTATTKSSQAVPYVLAEKRNVCNPALQESLIQIEVFDADGDPLANAEILVSWTENASRFYTGYFPEISAGYADFTMEIGTSYLVQVGEIGEIVQNLTAPQCEEDDLPFWGSIYLRFDEP